MEKTDFSYDINTLSFLLDRASTHNDKRETERLSRALKSMISICEGVLMEIEEETKKEESAKDE